MAVRTAMASSSLVEVVDRILDKGIVVDVWARVSLVGIELLAIEADNSHIFPYMHILQKVITKDFGVLTTLGQSPTVI
ncbi:MAG: gas vesicle protein GVPa [Firmicutes bacterium]|nr:gas vesicle protein GVPa [Bacillota bacterium]